MEEKYQFSNKEAPISGSGKSQLSNRVKTSRVFLLTPHCTHSWLVLTPPLCKAKRAEQKRMFWHFIRQQRQWNRQNTKRDQVDMFEKMEGRSMENAKIYPKEQKGTEDTYREQVKEMWKKGGRVGNRWASFVTAFKVYTVELHFVGCKGMV